MATSTADSQNDTRPPNRSHLRRPGRPSNPREVTAVARAIEPERDSRRGQTRRGSRDRGNIPKRRHLRCCGHGQDDNAQGRWRGASSPRAQHDHRGADQEGLRCGRTRDPERVLVTPPTSSRLWLAVGDQRGRQQPNGRDFSPESPTQPRARIYTVRESGSAPATESSSMKPACSTSKPPTLSSKCWTAREPESRLSATTTKLSPSDTPAPWRSSGAAPSAQVELADDPPLQGPGMGRPHRRLRDPRGSGRRDMPSPRNSNDTGHIVRVQQRRRRS